MTQVSSNVLSQLLDLLLEVNESSRIPIHLRYDLRSPTPSESAIPGLEPDLPTRKTYDTSSARAALEEAKTELETGQISPRSYNKLEVAINETLQNPVSLSDLRCTTHSQLGSVKALPHDIGDALPAGYLTFEHEEEYLSALDAAAGVPPSSSQMQPDSHPIRSNEKEKELALRNPVSVYNWLRKNHPSIFLQDSDSSPDKPTTKSSGGSRSAKKAASVVKAEEEVLDEAGNIVGGIPAEAPQRSKRKREDEPYRPKGGSSRPSKRKKTSVGQSEKPHLGEDEGL